MEKIAWKPNQASRNKKKREEERKEEPKGKNKNLKSN